MKKLIAIVAALVLTACSSSGNSPAPNPNAASTTPGDRVDLTGTYEFQDIECYSLKGDLLSSNDLLDYTDKIVIADGLVRETQTNGTCTVELAGHVTATRTAIYIPDMFTTKATSGQCTIMPHIDDPSAFYAYDSVKVYIQNLTAIPSETLWYLYEAATNEILLDTIFISKSVGQGHCYSVYQKTN